MVEQLREILALYPEAGTDARVRVPAEYAQVRWEREAALTEVLKARLARSDPDRPRPWRRALVPENAVRAALQASVAPPSVETRLAGAQHVALSKHGAPAARLFALSAKLRALRASLGTSCARLFASPAMMRCSAAAAPGFARKPTRPYRLGRGSDCPVPNTDPGRAAGPCSERIGEQKLASVEVSRARVIKRGGVRAQDRAVDDAAEDQFMVAGRMVAVQRAIEIRERIAQDRGARGADGPRDARELVRLWLAEMRSQRHLILAQDADRKGPALDEEPRRAVLTVDGEGQEQRIEGTLHDPSRGECIVYGAVSNADHVHAVGQSATERRDRLAHRPRNLDSRSTTHGHR